MVEDFLVKSSNPAALNEFHTVKSAKYKIKRLRKTQSFLGWYFN